MTSTLLQHCIIIAPVLLQRYWCIVCVGDHYHSVVTAHSRLRLHARHDGPIDMEMCRNMQVTIDLSGSTSRT